MIHVRPYASFLFGKLHLARTFRLPQNDLQQRIKRLKTEILRITAAFENIYAFDFNIRSGN
jgi:hypothetical protein